MLRRSQTGRLGLSCKANKCSDTGTGGVGVLTTLETLPCFSFVKGDTNVHDRHSHSIRCLYWPRLASVNQNRKPHSLHATVFQVGLENMHSIMRKMLMCKREMDLKVFGISPQPSRNPLPHYSCDTK